MGRLMHPRDPGEWTEDPTLAFTAAALLRSAAGDETELPLAANGRFTRDEIIGAILRWHARHGEPPKSIDWDPSRARRRGQDWRAERFTAQDWPTLAMVRRQFGTMSDALEAAGLPRRARPIQPRARILSREDILRALREWDRRYGEPPALADWAPARARRLKQSWRAERYLAGDWPHLSTVLKRFGTFGAAVRAAGLEPRPRGRHVRGHSGLHPGTEASVALELAAAEARCGPGELATRVRAVAEARVGQDPTALRSALIQLATAALSWADEVATVTSVHHERCRAA
jgi:hypothetical protein